MALMKPVDNCDFNHNFEHGNATTSDDFSWWVSKADDVLWPVANCDFNHNFEHGNATTAKV